MRRQVEQMPDITLGLLREALELAAHQRRLQIRLNPDDFKTLEPKLDRLLAELGPLAPARSPPDASITPGGCRVETEFGVIDQQFEAQLARIQEELS